MPVKVNIPDVGAVNFPDGMSMEEIASTIREKIIPKAETSTAVSSPSSAPSSAPSGAPSGAPGIIPPEVIRANRSTMPGTFGRPSEQGLGALDTINQAAQTRGPQLNKPLSQTEKFVEGLGSGMEETVRSLATPEGVATAVGLTALSLFPPTAPIGLSLTAGLGAKGLGESAGRASVAIQQSDIREAAKEIAPTVASLLMTAAPAGTILPKASAALKEIQGGLEKGKEAPPRIPGEQNPAGPEPPKPNPFHESFVKQEEEARLAREQEKQSAREARSQETGKPISEPESPIPQSPIVPPIRPVTTLPEVHGTTSQDDKSPLLSAPESALPPQASLPVNPLPESERTLGIVAPAARGILSIGLPNFHPIKAIQNLWDTISGKSMPRITEANRDVGELGVRYASSRVAAEHQGALFGAKVLDGLDINARSFGAWLTEDNLRSIRQGLFDQAHAARREGNPELARELDSQAGEVRTIIGEKNSPFRNEEDYQDFFRKPEVQEALTRHKQYWQETVDPMYKAAMDIDPNVELPSRGLQSGARINLKAILEGDAPSTSPVTTSRGNLTSSFKKKSPFGRQAFGTADNYESWYPDIVAHTFNRQLEIANQNRFNKSLVENELAEVDAPGQKVEIDGKPTVSFPLQRRLIITTKEGQTQTYNAGQNIYVRADLAPEYRQALNVDSPHKYPLTEDINGLLNKSALAGLTDVSTHVLNLFDALIRSPNGNPIIGTATKLAGRSDLLVQAGRVLAKSFSDNREQLAELAGIGALRDKLAVEPSQNVIGAALQAPGKVTRSIIQWADSTTRLVLDDTFQKMAENGLVENTETARREFVNQVGQYNKRLQDKFTVWLRDTGLGPFVTAGKTFNSMGVRAATLNPGVKGATAAAEVGLRTEQISNWIGTAVTVGVLNYMFTGSFSGREGNKLGNIDFGLNDKNGKPTSFPAFGLLGLDRAERVTGVKGAIESVRQGLPLQNAVDSAFRDLFNSWTAPMAGPAVRAASVTATGYPPAIGVPREAEAAGPNQSQALERLWAAGRGANPVLKSYLDYREGKPWSDIMATQLPRLVMRPGMTPERFEAMPKIVEGARLNDLIDDSASRLRKLGLTERIDAASKIADVRELNEAQRKKFFDGLMLKGIFKHGDETSPVSRAKGGPVSANQPYVVGEKGPETFVPNGSANATTSAGRKHLLVIGGSGSTINENLFPLVRDAAGDMAKSISYYPLRGTGQGMDQVGIGKSTKEIGDLLKQKTANGDEVNVVAHSLAAPILFNYLRNNPNPNVHPTYIDAPNLKPWMHPGPDWTLGISPTAKSIVTANKNGIASDPNHINWTSGDWLFNKAKHSPWNYPDAPGAKQQISDLQDLIRNSLGGGATNATSPKVVGAQGPEVIVPKQSGSIIPNPQ